MTSERQAMQVSEKTLTFDRSLWVQYDGVDVQSSGAQVTITGRDDESYLKVLNHFGRVLKLYTFEGGRWVDADTGAAAQPFDESQAGKLPAVTAGPGTPASAPRAAANKPARSPRAKTAAAKGSARGGTAKGGPAKGTAKRAPRAAKKPAGKTGAAKRSGRRGG